LFALFAELKELELRMHRGGFATSQRSLFTTGAIVLELLRIDFQATDYYP
jgi:hypothetical protein